MTTRTVSNIYRYPVKGLSPQALPDVVLLPGKPFPFDRVFALLRPGKPTTKDPSAWAKKGNYLMLMLEHRLASIETLLDPVTLRFTVAERKTGAVGGKPTSELVLDVNLDNAAGRQAVEAYVHHLLPQLTAAPTLVRARNGHFMDKPDSVLSCINLATVRELERDWGVAIDPLRFRANFYIEGTHPWEEFAWIGRELKLGEVVFQVDRRNGRCGATNVNPSNAQCDLDIPGSLRKTMGHKDLGVYLVTRTQGRVTVGDAVTAPDVETSIANARTPASTPALGSFICRGCYYIYDQISGAPGVPVGTVFRDIADDWRCPDCGTHKGNFEATWSRDSVLQPQAGE